MKLWELTAYSEEKFHIKEQHKWTDFPGFSVLAAPDTGKWIALLMRQWDSYLGEEIQRCDIKCGRQILSESKAPYLSLPFRMKGNRWVGVKFDDRIVNAFAENFKEGALAWTKKEKYPTVDYVSAEDLVQFCNMWYMGRNSCKAAVMELYGRTYPTSIDKAMYRIMDATDVYYQKQQ